MKEKSHKTKNIVKTVHIDSPITNVPAKFAKSSIPYTPAKSVDSPNTNAKSSITDAARPAKSSVTDAPAKSANAHKQKHQQQDKKFH